MEEVCLIIHFDVQAHQYTIPINIIKFQINYITSLVLVRELRNVLTLRESTVNGGGMVCFAETFTESNPCAIHSILHQLILIADKPKTII